MLRDLFLGFIRIHILFHAAEAPAFGIALMAELGRHGYRVGPGTLYPILHKLDREGYLRREERVIEGKVRKYCRATPAGARLLAQARVQLQELVAEALPGDEQDHSENTEAASPRRGGEDRKEKLARRLDGRTKKQQTPRT